MLTVSATDEQLLTEFAACGAPELFTELYRRLFWKVVFYIGATKRVSIERACDVAQDAFVAVLGHASQFRSDANASTWICAIARNRLCDLNRIRRLRDDQQADDVNLFGQIIDQRNGPHDELAEAEERQRLARFIANVLPSSQADVIRLLDFEGLEYQDAAERLGIPVGTVRSRRHRALNHLRKVMAA